EEKSFCLEIALHSAVVIEVVASEVGEDDDVKLESVDPPLIEAVRRDLHRHSPYAAIDERSQHALQLDRTRCGKSAAAWNDLAVASQQNSQRTDRRARRAAILEKVAHDRCRCRLAVGAGYTEESEYSRRLTISDRCGKRGRPSSFTHGKRRQCCSRRIFDNRHHGASLGRGVEKIVAVAVPASHSDKSVASNHLATIVGDTTHFAGNFPSHADQQAALG